MTEERLLNEQQIMNIQEVYALFDPESTDRVKMNNLPTIVFLKAKSIKCIPNRS